MLVLPTPPLPEKKMNWVMLLAPFRCGFDLASVGYAPTLITLPCTTMIGRAAICFSRTRRITSALLRKALGLAGHLVAFHLHALGLQGQDHLVHVQQGLVEGRPAQSGRAAHRRVKEFHVTGAIPRLAKEYSAQGSDHYSCISISIEVLVQKNYFFISADPGGQIAVIPRGPHVRRRGCDPLGVKEMRPKAG